MKRFLYGLLFATTCLTGCEPKNRPQQYPRMPPVHKPNAVKEYFTQNKWSYPYKMDSLQPILFQEYRDSPQMFLDSNSIQSRRTILFGKAVGAFMKQGIDTACGYLFTHPCMFRKEKGKYYRLFVMKYENSDPRYGCECLELDSNRVHAYGCRMQFEILRNDSLRYEGCRD